MRYTIDNDLHIHSQLSLCSDDPNQSPERILRYAIENGLKTVCLTDHFWDESIPLSGVSPFYQVQNYEHVSSSFPLPQSDNVRFLFGCETELDQNLTLGISKEKFDLFDFIVIPTTHFHMVDFTVSKDDLTDAMSRANTWIRRLDALLEMDLPFHKIGIAHLTCSLIAPSREEYIEVLRQIPVEEMNRLFCKAAQFGVGIELNSFDMVFSDEEAEIVLKPYRIAKQCGCKFYCGSDAHHPEDLNRAKAILEKAVDLLELTNEDKFVI